MLIQRNARQVLTWHTDTANSAKVEEYGNSVLNIMRSENESEWADFSNAVQPPPNDGPIGLRYRGKERLEKLRRLKKEWDPEGMFTTQLLS